MSTSKAPSRAADGARPGTRPTAASNRPRGRLVPVAVTGGLLLSAVLSFASHELGATPHSVISIAVLGVVVWHVVSQRRWIRSVVRRRLRHPDRVLVAYNTAFAAVAAVAFVSGVPLWLLTSSGVLLQVHLVSGVAFLVMVVGHLLLNGRRLLAAVRLAPDRPG